MNIKRIISIVALSTFSVLAIAQTAEKPVRLGIAVTAGASSYMNVAALEGTLASYETQALSVDWTDKGAAFGFEGSIVIKQNWKLDLGGTFTAGLNPGRPEYTGAIQGSIFEPGDIPSYRAVATQSKMKYLAYLAASYYFTIPAVPALKPYVGLKASGSYAQNQKVYDEIDSMGVSVGETVAISGSVLLGVDYYITNNLFVGVGIDAARYTYGLTNYRPQEGLATLQADTHHMSALACPTLKIGILF